jgi:hypothetical protein
MYRKVMPSLVALRAAWRAGRDAEPKGVDRLENNDSL